MLIKKPDVKLRSADSIVVRGLASEIVGILVRAATGRISRRRADTLLERIMMDNRGRIDVALVGNLSSRATRDRFVDAHIPLKNGGTLTISLTGPGLRPPLIGLAQGPLLSDDDDPATVEYYNTKTKNSGMDDTQGDSRAD